MEKQTTPRIVVIEGPSGAGKDTVIKQLIKNNPNRFAKLVSVATRAMRPNEREGNPYHFVSNDEFDAMVKSGDIFEFTLRHGEKRGMSAKYIQQVLDQNKIPLKDCNLVGVRALKSRFDNVTTIFLTAPKAVIAKRLKKRGDSPAEIAERLMDYDQCMAEADQYDFVIENTDLKKTLETIIKIIDKSC